MFLSKQAVTKCRKKQVSIVPQIRQKVQHFLSSTNIKINNHDIEIDNTMRFLGVLLDDNLLWKEHTKYLKNKIAKNIELIYRTKSFLEKESLLALYYSLIHSYLNCANLAWGSTYLTNLKKTTQETRVVHNLNIHKNFSNQQMYWIYINLIY